MTASPTKIDLEADKIYSWCTCGLTSKGPFCDGSHKGKTEKKSLKFTVSTPETVYLCNCKNTKTPPFCDGSHDC